MAGTSRQHEEVKQLMRPEDARRENGPGQDIDQGAHAVQDTPQQQRQEAAMAQVPCQLTVAEERSPAHAEVDQRGSPGGQDAADPDPRSAESRPHTRRPPASRAARLPS